MTDQHLHPTLRELACELGYVQIHWCFLESMMRSRLETAGVTGWNSRSRVVHRWRAYIEGLPDADAAPGAADLLVEVENAARMRNLLAHAIQSASANPWEEGTAAVICVDLTGAEHRFTLDMIKDLNARIQQLSGRL